MLSLRGADLGECLVVFGLVGRGFDDRGGDTFGQLLVVAESLLDLDIVTQVVAVDIDQCKQLLHRSLFALQGVVGRHQQLVRIEVAGQQLDRDPQLADGLFVLVPSCTGLADRAPNDRAVLAGFFRPLVEQRDVIVEILGVLRHSVEPVDGVASLSVTWPPANDAAAAASMASLVCLSFE